LKNNVSLDRAKYKQAHAIEIALIFCYPQKADCHLHEIPIYKYAQFSTSTGLESLPLINLPTPFTAKEVKQRLATLFHRTLGQVETPDQDPIDTHPS
jgi:hypothetical protein